MVSPSGTLYGSGGAANYEIRRHAFHRSIEVEPGTAKVIPILGRVPISPTALDIDVNDKIAAEGGKVWATPGVLDGSRVNSVKLDVLVKPKTPTADNVLDFYTARGAFAFHDLKGASIYGLDWADSNNVPQYSNEAQTPAKSNVFDAAGYAGSGPACTIGIDDYNYGSTIKHWWPRMRKTVLYSGQPAIYSRWERVPRKCKRMNEGTLYCLFVLNDSDSVTGDKDVVKIELHEEFNEIPLVQ